MKNKRDPEALIHAFKTLQTADGSYATFKQMMAYLKQHYDPSYYTYLVGAVIQKTLYFDHIDEIFEMFVGNDDSLNEQVLRSVIMAGRGAFIDKTNTPNTINAVRRFVELSPKSVVDAVFSHPFFKEAYATYFQPKSIDPVLNEIALKRNVILSRLRKNRQTGELLMKACKNAETLGALEWTGVPEANRYGPMTDGYCYDVKELSTVIIGSFQKGLWPSSPYTKKPFTLHQLQDIVNHMVKKSVKHSPLLPMLVFGFQNGYIPLHGIDATNDYSKRLQFYTAIRTFLTSSSTEFIGNEHENWNYA